MQISGHKNVAFINNYSTLSEERHKKISNILSNTESETNRNAFQQTYLVKPPQILQPVALLMFRVEAIPMFLLTVPIQICQVKLVLCFTAWSSITNGECVHTIFLTSCFGLSCFGLMQIRPYIKWMFRPYHIFMRPMANPALYQMEKND